MTKYLIAGFCGIALAGGTYVAGRSGMLNRFSSQTTDADCEFCVTDASVVLLDVAATSTSQPAKIDMKNTKCIVAGDEINKSTLTVEYKGKVYHICCEDCISEFSKDAAKYVKAFDADPSKFGVKK